MSPDGAFHYDGGWNRLALIALAVAGALSIGLSLLGAYRVIFNVGDWGWLIGCRGPGLSRPFTATPPDICRRRRRRISTSGMMQAPAINQNVPFATSCQRPEQLTVRSLFAAAAEMAFKAIERVAKTDKDGNIYIGKKALRDVLFVVKFDGLSGRIAFDPYGQCEAFEPAVNEFVSANPKTFSIGQNPKKVWP
jgi:hypothetical protein